MPSLTAAQRVWNRACDLKPASPLPGDRALQALLSAHGMIMNGGVLHVFETLEPDELDAAKAGYRYFGLDDIADLIVRVKAMPEGMDSDAEPVLDRDYARLLPSDGDLIRRFEDHYRRHPEAYAPVA